LPGAGRTLALGVRVREQPLRRAIERLPEVIEKRRVHHASSS
jgi:hypothetical protein